jgi:putative acetyltransferase
MRLLRGRNRWFMIIIRTEEPTDIADIRKVVEEAFPKPLEARLVDQLRANGSSVISLVAVDDGKVVGHAQFSNMTAPFRALGLGPVSVMPDRQRSGIGSQMIRAGLKHAADAGWEGVFVLGNPKYYQRFGFNPDRARGFESPYSGAHFMLLTLNGDRPLAMGKVNYAPAFAALG